MEKMKEMSLNDFIKDLSSDSFSPSGGAGCALVLAIANSLATMAANLTKDKKKFQDKKEYLESLIEKSNLLNIKLLDASDKEWLAFIVDSRKAKCPWEGYDIIEGGVANDRVIDAVEAYINGYADVEHTLRQLVYHKPNYQICILNQQIADEYLQFKSNERV